MEKQKQQIRRWLLFFMIALTMSGVTAIPVNSELAFIVNKLPAHGPLGSFLQAVSTGIANTQQQYPFLFYGYDWLAFAHFVLAILFIGPLKDPVRNKWVIEFGMIACVLIIPVAMIAGFFRGIPFWWRLIDCSFGLIGILPLYYCYTRIRILEKSANHIS